MTRNKLIALNNTAGCNLNCIYCSTKEIRNKTSFLSLDEKKKLIKDCKELGYNLISLSGSGEPLLDKDFFYLFKFIINEGLAPIIVTNGVLIDENYAKLFFKNKALIIFKFNSFDANINNKLIGNKKSPYKWADYDGKKIPLGLKYLLNLGYTNLSSYHGIRPLQIQSVITKLNYQGLPEVAEFCKRNNIHFFVEDLILAGKVDKGLKLDKGEYEWLYKRLRKILRIKFVLKQKKVGCTLGLNPIIDVNGDVLTCYTRGIRIGNVRDEPLKELFEKCERIKKKNSLKWYKGFNNRFKTCPSREYFNHVKLYVH